MGHCTDHMHLPSGERVTCATIGKHELHAAQDSGGTFRRWPSADAIVSPAASIEDNATTCAAARGDQWAP